ncbi:hypothetical protein AAHC03_016767 [Spirometra sp. Aus1]
MFHCGQAQNAATSKGRPSGFQLLTVSVVILLGLLLPSQILTASATSTYLLNATWSSHGKSASNETEMSATQPTTNQFAPSSSGGVSWDPPSSMKSEFQKTPKEMHSGNVYLDSHSAVDFVEDVTHTDSEVEALPTLHDRVDGSRAQFGTRDVENMEDAYKPIVHSQSEHSVTASKEEGNESSDVPVTSGKANAQISTSWENDALKETSKAKETRPPPQRKRDDGGDVAEEPRWRSRRAATSDRSLLWFRGVIPYEIDSILSGPTRTAIVKAMRMWENETCLNFVERESQHRSYLIFTALSCG